MCRVLSSDCIIFYSRMEETFVCDIQFLHGCAQPTIALLHQDVHGRHIKTREISLKDKEFVKVRDLASNKIIIF